MADSFSKKQSIKNKALKQKEKDKKKADRKLHNNKGKGFDSMIVYVDENGHFTSTKPEPKPEPTVVRTPSRYFKKEN
ncbi:MAG: hypothetical protein RLZZ500_2090 [Bacteroidota bacterium]|jgi:CspA family cold shock protein